MGIFDMGEGGSSFGEGMSELRGGNEARERQELLRAQQAGAQQQNQRQSAIQRARAMKERAENLKKKVDRIRKLRNLRYMRYLGCCLGSSTFWLILIAAIIVIFASLNIWGAIWDAVWGSVSAAVDKARDAVPLYDRVIIKAADFGCWVSGNC